MATAPVGPWRPTSKRELKKYEQKMRHFAPLKPFTVLAEEAIPPVPEVENAKSRSSKWLNFTKEVPSGEQQQAALRLHSTAPLPLREKTLDGFMILDCGSASLPHQVTRIRINDENLVDVVAVDLAYFTALMFVDLGDNRLTFEKLSGLPAVIELRLHCNAIRTIGDFSGFATLEVLDLSYNAVTAEGIAKLAELPNLRELDLTCNALESLPDSMAPFRKLEVLILERNRLEADQHLISLSQAPRLRELNLSYNYFKRVPTEAGSVTSFKMLEWLNLAHNYIASEADIIPLVKFPRLLQVILYGNPITDSKTRREQASATARPSTVPEAGLDAHEGDGKIVNLVTDVPVAKASKRGAYNSFRITRVVDNAVPSATQWREAGNRALFGDDSDDGEDLYEELPPPMETKPKKKKKRAPSERADFFITAGDEDGVSVDSSEDDSDSDEGLSVPAMLLQSSLQGPSGPGSGGGDPARLRAAINALRHALKHPLTSHVSRSAKSAVERPTAIHKMRQKPIKPYNFERGRGVGGGGRVTGLNVAKHHLRGLETGGPVTRTTFVGAGAGGPGSARDHLDDPDANEKTLEKMEAMLERMDSRMQSVEDELGAATHHDKSMGLLMDMVGKVMESYD